YNFETSMIGPWFLGYNNQITYDWNAEDEAWQIPLGLTVGKTFLSRTGTAISVNVGGYGLVEPNNGNDWELTFGINFLF
ncbi:MAG: hypothetical protein AAGH89_00370, partial [Verrucomicrobiota bacterium]